jgi:imidazolonepropionase-like amidohydrolase
MTVLVHGNRIRVVGPTGAVSIPESAIVVNGAGKFLIPGLLVEAGLTPLEALRSATLNPAKFLAATDSLGTTESGKLADLVLVEANPLENIANARKIAAVVLNGRYFDRLALDALLARATAEAGR